MSNHILRYPYIMVDFAIVDLEDEAYEVGEDRCCSRLRFYGGHSFACLRPYNREPCWD